MIENLLPKYLFKKKSSTSTHIPQGALFSPNDAIQSDQGFQPLVSPSEELQKKQIYLDYQSIFRLWDKNERALIIAKLKDEGFEIFFIYERNAKPVSAEIDRDLKVKVDDVKKSIFLLEDEDLKKLSQFDQDKVIDELSLAIDDSIILKYDHFKEIADILEVNSWVQKGIFKSNLRLTDVDFLNESKIQINKNFISKQLHKIQKSVDLSEKWIFAEVMINYFKLPDFDIENDKIRELLNIFLEIWNDEKIHTERLYPDVVDYRIYIKMLFMDRILVDSIKPIYQNNPENLKKIFDHLLNYPFSIDREDDKIIFQKFIIFNFWFYYPDFDELIIKAQTIKGFEQFDQNQIATHLLSSKIFTINQFDKHIDIERIIGCDYNLDKVAIKKYIEKYSAIQDQAINGRIDIYDYLMILMQYDAKLKFYINQEWKIILSIDYEGSSSEGSFNPELLIQLLNNKELNDKFRIDELLIKYFEIYIKRNFLLIDIADSIQYYYELISYSFDYLPNNLQEQFIKKLNEFIDNENNLIFLNKIDKIENPKILTKICSKIIEKISNIDRLDNKTILSLIKIFQHVIENKRVKDFVEKILTKNRNKQKGYIGLSNLTPKFEDFLIKLYQDGKIDLAKFSFDKKSKISEKFWKELLLNKKTKLELGINIHIPPEIYLANYNKAHENRFETELSEVSSKQLNQSPIQFYLIDLNQKSPERIKDLIAKEKLKESKIISLNILGFECNDKESEETETTNNRKKELITEVIKLFPNLKHLRVNKDYFGSQDIDKSIDSGKLAIEFVDYGNNEISRAIDEAQARLSHQTPQQYQQNKSGDRLLISNKEAKGIASKLSNNTFNMVDAGRIIHRPASKANNLKIRSSSNKLKLTNISLKNDWLPSDDDQSQLIDPLKIFSKQDFKQFSPDQSEKETHSFCSSILNLKANKKSKLLSISPDNEIVGYFTDPKVDDIKFFKDDAGFFYVKSPRKCAINYILKGQELDLKTPQDDLEDLPDSVKQIINQYRGDNKQNFPLSITESQYILPDYNSYYNSFWRLTCQLKKCEQYNKEWLDKLFEIDNKGSCRHRVMALANKFLVAGLQYNQHFRIIGVDNNHILFEVKNQSGAWITLNLGGSQSQLNYPDSIKNEDFSDEDEVDSIISSHSPSQSFSDEDEVDSIISSHSPSQSPRPLMLYSSRPHKDQDDPEFQIIEEEILKLYQLQSSINLKEFQQSLTTFIQTSEDKSLLLITRYFQELKNYLLSFKKTSFALEIVDREISHEDSDLSFYIIESPQDLAITKNSIKITASNSKITSQTPLAEFFTQAKSQDQKTHLLIIDWQKFDDKHRVASNTMFDNQSKRTIDGVEIPDNVKIICIDEAKSQSFDPAVLSRFNQALDLSSIPKTALLGINPDEDQLFDSQTERIGRIIEFDCEGMDNWQQKLFGRIIVNGEDLEWQKSNFVEELESSLGQSLVKQGSKTKFQFKNFSKNQQQQVLELFNQARIQGFISYFGHEIKILQNFSIKFDQTEFDFKGILKSFSNGNDVASQLALSPASSSPNPQQITLKIHKNIQSLDAIDRKENLIVINSQLFDQLLVKKSIEGSRYQENQGLIKEHKSQTLKLFITEQLTPAQFYCLMYNAQKYQVSLELYFAKNVKIDDKNFFRFYQSSIAEIAGDQVALASPTYLSSTQSRIIISNDAEKAFSELKQKLTTSADSSSNKINIVNIEDVLFGDLFDDVKYQITESSGKRYFSFQKQESEVVQKLKRDEVVVLKGKFPPKLLSSLHEQILDLKTKYPNLYFIIEEDILQLSKESSQLVWLDPKRYSIAYYRKEKIKGIEIVKEDTVCVENQILENSQQQAQDFITRRKTKLKELLDVNSTLQIIGHSGVGKSSLFREIKKTGFVNQGDVEVYEELTSFEKWASNSSKTTKILVIDEFNVDGSTNFTMFRDFVNARPDSADQSMRQIFYKGKFYNLTDKHKVVFLGNPHNYGNRYKHKLFSDCQIQEWQLMDFSQSYIYENILKEPIFDKLSHEIKGQLSEEKFKEIAVESIRKYYENNTKKSDDESDLPQETVRELQERVLQEIVKQTQINITQKVANDNFISTQANQETIKQLQIAIQIRQLQKQGDFPPECLGTNGVIFEGDSGIGKSVMIEAVLQNQGIKKIANLDLLKLANPLIARQADSSAFQSSYQESQPQYFYYKIDASLSCQEIKEKLIQAFESGVIVVIDELNTRINEGLEKDINSLLTGQHPTDSSIKMKQGFMIITSVNKASSAGRANFSAAIKHRCNNISATPLKQYQVDDFVEIIFNWCNKNQSPNQGDLNLKIIKKIAENFKKLVVKNPQVNLRVLQTKFNEIAGQFLQKDQSLRASDQSLNPELKLKKIDKSKVHFYSL
jgi:hypothetical protein